MTFERPRKLKIDEKKQNKTKQNKTKQNKTNKQNIKFKLLEAR